MRWSLLAAAISASPLVMFSFAGLGGAQTPEGIRVSDPVVHENLAVYFIHGKSAPGKVPAHARRGDGQGRREGARDQQRQSARDRESRQGGGVRPVRRHREGRQAGSHLMVSLVLPPKSGSIPIASFCVEEGRWSARGREDVKSFSTASAAVPSREMKLAMKAPLPAAPAARSVGGVAQTRRDRKRLCGAETGQRQQQVWEGVRKTQAKLADRVGAPVRSAQSASSLQLALENEKLDRRAAGLHQGAQGGRRERRRHRRLCLRHQRRAQQRRRLSVERPVPENVDQALDRERDRGDRPQERADRRGAVGRGGDAPSSRRRKPASDREAAQCRACGWRPARATRPISSRPRVRASPSAPAAWVHRNYLAK